jgi:glycosyltransferase involved in cell wall biosynthesis
MERVMVELADTLANFHHINLISLTKGNSFYHTSKKVNVLEPEFNYLNYNRLTYTLKTLWFIRKELQRIKPSAVLSFGGKYNSFVLLSGLGLRLNIYISDRSRPGISYGKFLDAINPMVYKLASGIVAQTEIAKEVAYKSCRHTNIKVIGNPIRKIANSSGQRKRIILNVGRFIKSKHQDWLVDYFESINTNKWQLVFLGKGSQLREVQFRANKSALAKQINFAGNVKDVDTYYNKASIFAFTSTSEGFPNALGEAMAAGCACISFDCEAGPADLIDDGENGFLVPVGDHKLYKERLQQLTNNEELRIRFGKKAQEKMKQFRVEKIAKEYLDFILPGNAHSY